MKLLVFTKGDAPEMRDAIELGKEIEAQGYEVSLLETEEAEALNKVELYDVYSTPTFLVIKDDGQELQKWKGYIPPRGELLIQLNN